MTAQHTPVPWILDATAEGWVLLAPEHWHDVCSFDATEEDARLIAAAPDLLEALADAVNELQTLIRCDNPNNPITNATTDMRIDRALTAIRKARGEDA